MGIPIRECDVVVVGAGVSGMRAALQMVRQGLKCIILSKVFPTRSNTASAQGGISAALGNRHADDWQWHMYDTVKGADYLGDQQAIEYMCKNAADAVIELEHMGLPFSRDPAGRIDQQSSACQFQYYGGEQAARTAIAGNSTGHTLLHTLYQQNIKYGTTIFSEWYALDLVRNQDGIVRGCVALEIETGELCYFNASATVLATGGAGCIYASTTNAGINTGDGIGMALRAGVPVQDMEMWQFHPTALAGSGILVSEICRGEGAYLQNRHGEAFMQRYAPSAGGLAGRDIVSRAIMQEIREGRGCGIAPGSYVHLRLEHLREAVPGVRLTEFCERIHRFAGVDPLTEPVPVVPACHYMMGGIPVRLSGQVLRRNRRDKDEDVPGLFACGETASVSVHGANRIGGNRLLEDVVFGRETGQRMRETLESQTEARQATGSDLDTALQRAVRWERSRSGEAPAQIRREIQRCMQQYFSVFRQGESMVAGLKELQTLRERLQEAYLADKSLIFNTQRVACLELDNLLETATATAIAANYRTESRGAHARDDYPDRDDKHWLCHTLYNPETGQMSKRDVNLQPVSRDVFPPKARIY